MVKLRQATIDDAAAIQSIYAPYVAGTAISFEVVPPDAAEMHRRIDRLLPCYPYFVAEQDDRVCGYAYASEHRSRSAYRTSIDVAVYVAAEFHRQGIGRTLLGRLIPSAAELGYHAAFAGIALPNPASISLHESLGFTPVGVYHEVGWKLGAWHDVGWWQRLL